ncbi:MAG: phosphatase PAP2 family protein [DPANN group archaeon]|nr:phosphatase PAP2 family protein [DPANN group archaeon]
MARSRPRRRRRKQTSETVPDRPSLSPADRWDVNPDESIIRLFIAGSFVLVAAFFLDGVVREFFSLIRTPFFDFFMVWFSHGVTLFSIMFVMISLFLYDEGKKRAILPLWLSFFTSLFFSTLLKFIIQRPRPSLVHALPFLSFVGFSFPSAHTAIAFCAVPLVRKAFPRVSWFFIFFAVLVGISRIYVDAHYLSDVVGGALLGLLVGFLVLKAWGGDIGSSSRQRSP